MSKEAFSRLLGLKLSFFKFTGSAVLVAVLYLVICAKTTYEAEVQLIIRQNKGAASSLIPSIAASLFGGGQTAPEDAYILSGYLHSGQFISIADERLDLKAHYASPVFDPLHALRKKPKSEEFYAYMRDRIIIKINPESDIVTIQTRAFSPEKALALANLVVEESEKAINNLNTRMSISQTSLAAQELTQNQATLLNKRQQLLQFQTDNSIVDPTSEVGNHLTNIAGLDSQLVNKRTELRAKQQFLNEDAFEIKSLLQEIRALDDQRRQETGTLIASGDKSMAAVLIKYEDLKIQTDFAQQAYSSAFALVEAAKLDSAQQKKFLLMVAPPFLPEKPVYPKPLSGALTIFVVAAVLFGTVRLLVATIRDHTL